MLASFTTLAWMPGPVELGVILVAALLIFGRRLPDVARSMGKSIVEFKKGLKDVKDNINSATSQEDEQKVLPSDKDIGKDSEKDSGKDSEKDSGKDSEKDSGKDSEKD